MTKGNFISQLEEQLRGEIDQASINDNIRYYKEYIEDEMKKGKREKEVLESLGDPWAIAKSIIQAEDLKGDFGKAKVVNEYDSEYGKEYGNNSKGRGSGSGVKFHTFNIKPWKVLLFIVAVILIIVLSIFLIVSAVITLAPIILVVIGIFLLLRFLGRRK